MIIYRDPIWEDTDYTAEQYQHFKLMRRSFAITQVNDKQCPGCFYERLADENRFKTHCWRFVVTRDGLRGYRGCHENFLDRQAWATHVASTGGCRNPENVDNLKYDGVYWRLKEEDDKRKG